MCAKYGKNCLVSFTPLQSKQNKNALYIRKQYKHIHKAENIKKKLDSVGQSAILL